MRTMYDSVNPSAIPTTAQMVAGYVDGAYAWPGSAWARFPAAVRVRIAVFPSTNDGHVLDCETGDATPAQCPGWVQMRRAAGVDPTVYCAQSNWGNVQAAFTAAGVTQPHYWVAAYPGSGAGTVPSGAVAHQYADPTTSGGNWDLSAVLDYWPGVDATPPTSQEDDSMIIECDQLGIQAILSGGILTGLDAASIAAVSTTAFPRAYVTSAVFNDLQAKSNALQALGAKVDACTAAVQALPPAIGAAVPAAPGGLTQAQFAAAVQAGVKAALSGETVTFQ